MRILIVGRTRYRLPLDPTVQKKFDALRRVSEVRVLGSAADSSVPADPTFHLVKPVRPRLLDGLAFHVGLPVRVAKELREYRPDAVLVQGAHDAPGVLLGRAAAHSDARVVVDVHGDWHASARLYGSPLRRLLAPLVDLLAKIGIRRADGVRTLSAFTSELVREEGIEPAAEFPAFVDFDGFRSRPLAPLPERPTLLFVGVLEQYKGIDVLAEAWRIAAPRVGEAELRLVGRGSRFEVVEQLLADLPRQTCWYPALPGDDMPEELDRATALVLPSRSEGLPRIVLEAFCRARPVVAATAGGTVDLVETRKNGLLVQPDDPTALADAIVALLRDREWAQRLGAAARLSAEAWLTTPEEYAERVRELVASLD